MMRSRLLLLFIFRGYAITQREIIGSNWRWERADLVMLVLMDDYTQCK